MYVCMHAENRGPSSFHNLVWFGLVYRPNADTTQPLELDFEAEEEEGS